VLDDLVLLDGSTFFLSDRAGDVSGEGERGFFFADVRHLSRWSMTVDGQPIRVLTVQQPDYYSARIFATLAEARVGVNPVVSVQRDRIVADGIHEDITLHNHGNVTQVATLELCFGADFADIFEVKDAVTMPRQTRIQVVGNEVVLDYDDGDYHRSTRVAFTEQPTVLDDVARFDVKLAPREGWNVCIDVYCTADGDERGPRAGHGGFGQLHPQMPLSLDEWLDDAPILESDCESFHHTYRQSMVDLAALRFRPWPDMQWSVPAAGLPWFMALFGRDSIITAYQALPFQPRLAAATLAALARCQATVDDPFRDAEPGKILHELRRGKLVARGVSPHSPYYGTHDATPLFLVLLDEYERWTGDTDLVRALEANARAALAWIDGPGDLDGDGFLEYRTRSERGLENQCWKDSWNSILFADGSDSRLPRATCEIQGYVYDAKIRTARLARTVWNDPALAARLEREAAALKRRFRQAFWIADRAHFALALDGDKRQVDALTSNIGHLLWSGIVDDDLAAPTAAALMGPTLFSGWGIRTMSTSDVGYNPIEYHNGTVWPHDSALIAEGLRRYGFRTEATRLAGAIVDAAGYFDHRLPEVFSGYDRAETTVPVKYPTASKPQAWAAGSALLALRTMLGLDVIDGTLRVDPELPDGRHLLGLSQVHVRGARVDT
jgi:glycogen debranching enzyme